jgi:tetratricopeptide (TPR) repeat protein
MCHHAPMRTAMLLLLLAATAAAQISDGDQQWALRAEGHQGGRAQAARIDAAIAAYQRTIAQNPNDLEARWKLLRAIRFKGAYVAQTNEAKKAVYAIGKKAGAEALAIASKLDRRAPGVAAVYLWDSILWGEWALAYGKMAAVREGAADRIRREATIAHEINPRLEGGTPSRVLGRLHDQTPRVPFLTGWASSKEAVRFLEESLRIDPANKITKVFLAEAMGKKPAAIGLLREVVTAPNDPEYAVEHAAATEEAQALLRKWTG